MDNITNKGHLFTVEILIEDTTNGQALEKLLHLLNSNTIKDFQIKSGIELGKLIQLNLKEYENNTDLEPPVSSNKAIIPSAPTSDRQLEQSEPPEQHSLIIEQLEKFKHNNTLIRLMVIKGKGIKLSLPCRILNYDSQSHNVSVYHVDEKKVYLFKLNEIDDFVIA
ncbi:hypothetical protein D3C73_526500 [compost metagenome]